jgi:hypothetical protein
MNKAVAALLACSFLALAQTPAPDKTEALYEPKYLTGNRLTKVVELVSTMVGANPAFGSRVQAMPELKVVIIKGDAALVTKAEEILKRFDVPQQAQPAEPPRPQTVFTVYMVRAATGPLPTKPGLQPHLRPVPAELESVIAEMKRSFSYDSYYLLDEVVMPVDGSITLNSAVPDASTNSGMAYFYTLRLSENLGDDRKTVTVSPFRFDVSIPRPFGNEMHEATSGISTTLRIQEGQKMVIGKVKLDPTDNMDIFLVLTVKLH